MNGAASVGGLVFRHIPFWQIQYQLYRLLAVVLRHLFLQLANGGAGLTHADDLVAPRNELPQSEVFDELLVPLEAGQTRERKSGRACCSYHPPTTQCRRVVPKSAHSM